MDTGTPEAARAHSGQGVLGCVWSSRCGNTSLNQLLPCRTLECPHHAHPSSPSERIPVQAACLLPWKHIQHCCPLLQHPAHRQPSPWHTPLQDSNRSRGSSSLGQRGRGLCSSHCWPAGPALAEPPRDVGIPWGSHSKAWLQVAMEHVLGDGGAAQLARGMGVAAGEGLTGPPGLVLPVSQVVTSWLWSLLLEVRCPLTLSVSTPMFAGLKKKPENLV